MFKKLFITLFILLFTSYFSLSYADDESSFDQLSPGNMKIAESIFNSQLDDSQK